MNNEIKNAYQVILDELFKYDTNPTYALSGLAIENLVGKSMKVLLSLEGYIKYSGKFNGLSVYQVR